MIRSLPVAGLDAELVADVGLLDALDIEADGLLAISQKGPLKVRKLKIQCKRSAASMAPRRSRINPSQHWQRHRVHSIVSSPTLT